MVVTTFQTVQACHREFRNELGREALGRKTRAPTPDVPNTPDPHSKKTPTTTTAVQSNARELGQRVPNLSRLGRGPRNGGGTAKLSICRSSNERSARQ